MPTHTVQYSYAIAPIFVLHSGFLGWNNSPQSLRIEIYAVTTRALMKFILIYTPLGLFQTRVAGRVRYVPTPMPSASNFHIDTVYLLIISLSI
ncbi:hypothetical protein BDZ91DRAFT_497348 [Kalaharituber pfeilii]|nr:hypothetical protein BDZ91DRAFT_497348 [Kalaharituber pfeilii]